MGRPNRAVQTVLGVLVLKEMFDPTNATWIRTRASRFPSPRAGRTGAVVHR